MSTAACWKVKFPQHTGAYWPDVQPWEHGGCTSPNNPHSEKHDEQSCWEHHLVGVGGSISYSQSKCHGSPETCQKEWNNTASQVQLWLCAPCFAPSHKVSGRKHWAPAGLNFLRCPAKLYPGTIYNRMLLLSCFPMTYRIYRCCENA